MEKLNGRNGIPSFSLNCGTLKASFVLSRKDLVMKLWTIAAGMLAGLVALSYALKRAVPKPVPSVPDEDHRYAIDELISDEEL
jgi:hypothetical protein